MVNNFDVEQFQHAIALGFTISFSIMISTGEVLTGTDPDIAWSVMGSSPMVPVVF